MTTPSNLPKSLHTVTVLVAVARHLEAFGRVTGDGTDPVGDALAILGYSDTPDAYGLAAKARALLEVRS